MSPPICPFGPHAQKYWDRRFDLFSRFDHGIQLDEEALFSVKPEVHAADIASRIRGYQIVDGFCGVGGVTIALARLGKKVTAVDISEMKLEMAKENAKIYGCKDNITFVQGDFLEFVRTLKLGTSIYLDPPWGGPDYYKRDLFRLSDFVPDGSAIINAALTHSTQVTFSVPTNFSIGELKRYGFDFEYRVSRSWGRAIFSTIYIDALGICENYRTPSEC